MRRFGADLDLQKVADEISQELSMRMPEGWGFVVAITPTLEFGSEEAYDARVATNLEQEAAQMLLTICVASLRQ